MSYSVAYAVIFLCIVFEASALWCNVTLKFENDGHQKARVDVVIPGMELESDPIFFNQYKDKKHVTVTGENCEKAPWVFTTKQYDPKQEKWIVKKTVKVRYAGNGWVRGVIKDNYDLIFLDRYGVITSS
ncbi:hypothetical protein WR25_01502 [Diploscapter pachys]|uniref:Uncharacterized protein n=1 Tax=Diploscapter pachys TaxID=2018661 RepID=A0A2A2J261_9BILA|nr:hypothetical protein WR25_01502 [Diploscapter pachys]